MKGKEQYENQQSLFDMEAGAFEKAPAKLEIVRANFIDSGEYSWEDLFCGFDELYAITYSSGIKFVKMVLSKFEKSEIIFGCEGVMDLGLETVVAMQKVSLEYLKKSKTLSFFADRIEQGTLQLHLSSDTKSHEKIYLLKSRDGRTRVITGSANMSASAFCGLQRENIVCFDDQAAYDYYFDLFQKFKQNCGDPVSIETVKRYENNPIDELRDDIDETPIIKEIEKKKIIILEDTGESDDDVEITTSVKNLAGEIKTVMPRREKEGNRILLTGDVSRAVRKRYKDYRNEEKEKRKVYPKLHIDYDSNTVSFNGKPIDINPTEEQIKSDVQTILGYFQSFDCFSGEVEECRHDYYAFMNWFFASPFMPYLRYIGHKHNYSLTSFPTVGILYGDSNAGKSTFISLLTKLMCGRKIPANSSNDFTSTQMDTLRLNMEGIPINVDDLAKQQFYNHCEKVIKDDSWGISEKRINYPAIAITTNKVPSLSPDISKRAVTCYIDARIEKEAAAKNAKKINDGMNIAGTALFGEYCRRMFVEIQAMARNMEMGDDSYFPDIFAVSSKVMKDIVELYSEKVPSFITELSYSDYFGAKVIAKKAIQKIKLAWKNEPKLFKVDRKSNQVTYTYPENGALYELTYLQQELPPVLNVKRVATSITMDLDAAEAFFKMRFRKRWFR